MFQTDPPRSPKDVLPTIGWVLMPVEQEHQRAEQERQRAERLMAQLRDLVVAPRDLD